MTEILATPVINLRISGARGPIGLDLEGPLTPGQFLVKAPGGARTFTTASGTGADAGLREDLAAAGGAANIGFTQAGTGMPEFDLETVVRETAVQVHLFRKATDPDDTLAATRAMAAGKTVRFVAGMGSDDDGAYLLDMLRITGNTELFGDGYTSVIKPASSAVKNAIWADSESITETLPDITIRNLKFLGSVVEDGFLEHFNLVELSGVEDTLIEGCAFIGFRSDGFMLEGGERFGIPFPHKRKNLNVMVRNCVFDGLNNDNRNGISSTGFDGLKILNCDFRNTTRSNMPGAIDFESNPATWFEMKNALIEGCTFDNIGGSAGCISIVKNPNVIEQPSSIVIRGNTFRNNTSSDLYVDMFTTFTDDDPDNGIIFESNHGFDGVQPFRIKCAKGVSVLNNEWQDYLGSAQFGPLAPAGALKKITLSGNTLLRTATSSNLALLVSSIAGLKIRNNRIEQFGPATSDAIAIFFTTGDNGSGTAITGTSSGVSVEDNLIIHGSAGAYAVYRGDHALSLGTNTYSRNLIGSLNAHLIATSRESILSGIVTWNPASLANGAGETSPSITVTGAAFGDFTSVGNPYDLQGLSCSAYVSAADTVKIRLHNGTGGAVDLAAGDWTVRVRKA